ncbi:MAG: Na/Pi cotransporter family protein [Lachnospiraceae bacterium]|nr:Na/Pi cotransporter family protein [Lachnospiraceae bacterium]
MTIFSLITLIGGLAFFLYGMSVLSGGLERIAGGRLETALKKLTSNRFKGLLLGAGVTAAIQSSSAVTVMLVGLVNSGIMTISQSIGVIMGSNIGTTMTAWILTLVGIESDNVFMTLLKPENFSLLFAFGGVIMIMASKQAKRRDIGHILVGFAVLMYGMKLMSSAVKPLADMPAFVNLFTAFQNPILGVLVGLLITAIIQSSSASVGILQALALTGVVSYGAAIPIIMGQNIGTCVTALISSIGVSHNAKKVAVVHVAFNIIGTTICLAAYCIVNTIFRFSFTSMPIDAVGIALIHTSFNVITTAMLIPFTGSLERLASLVMSGESSKTTSDVGEAESTASAQENKLLPAPLDMRLLATPSVAISECDLRAQQMCVLAKDTLLKVCTMFEDYSDENAIRIMNGENALDQYEDELGTYLVHLSARRLSEADSLKVSKILHVIGDFERLGDHAVNLLNAASELHEKGLSFSGEAKKDMNTLAKAINEILDITSKAYLEGNLEVAYQVEPLVETIDRLVALIKKHHIHRLQSGECSIELGFILSDVLNNLERVSDHCSNIAVAVIELSNSSFDTHKFLSSLRAESEQYKDDFDQYALKYRV